MEPENPYASPPGADLGRPADLNEQRAIEEAAKQLLRERHDKSTSWQLLLTGIIGCMAPVAAIYGIIFLLRRPYSFPQKALAIVGTILHCVWTVGLILLILTQ